MQSMSVIKNEKYYSDLAKEDYYTAGGEPAGQWLGKGALLLGLSGQIENEDYLRLIHGLDPDDNALVQNAKSNKRRMGWDLTFSANKSTSIAFARADEELRKAIQEAHFKAVKAAISFIEKHAAMTRRSKDGKITERVSGLVVAAYEHSTSRALDMQLHSHALVCNVAPRADGTWGALESRAFFEWQKASGTIYQTELANQMQQLGFEIEPEGNTFNIKNISKSLCQHFSKRGTDIKIKLKDAGLLTTSSKFGKTITLNTRKAKKEVNRAELFQIWQEEMDAKDFTHEALENIRTYQNQLNHVINENEVFKNLTEIKSTFKKQAIYEEIAKQAIASGKNIKDIENIAEQVLHHPEIQFLSNEERLSERFTTKEILNTERHLIQSAKRLQKRQHNKLDKSIVDTAIKQVEKIKQKEKQKDFKFDDEQIEAIYHGTLNSDVSIIEGIAGGGKTTSMEALKTAYDMNKDKVIGACIAKKAADNLQSEAGIESFTIASLVQKIENGDKCLNDVDVLIIDESGQVPSYDLMLLLYEADSTYTKVVLVGEQQQLDAIQHGGVLRYLSNHIIGNTKMQEIRRQNEEWARKAVMDFRNANSEAALKAYQDRKLLNFSEDAENTKAKLTQQWKQFIEINPNKKSLIIAQRWSDVNEISKQVRDYYQAKGLVSNENIKLKTWVAERQMEFEFSTGDRIKFCRNEYENYMVSNGTFATIEKIFHEDDKLFFEVSTDEGRRFTFSPEDYCDEQGRTYLSHAYALTVYAAQGTTVNGDTFLYYSSGMDRANTYVAASRHKDNCHIFINSKEIDESSYKKDVGLNISDNERIEILSKLMNRDNYQKLATEYISIHNNPSIEQKAIITKENEVEIEN